MKLYSTVRKEASAEQVIERSRFIAYVSPAETKGRTHSLRPYEKSTETQPIMCR